MARALPFEYHIRGPQRNTEQPIKDTEERDRQLEDYLTRVTPLSFGGWTKLVDDPLTQGTLDGFTARTGTWSAGAAGISVIAGSERFLTLETRDNGYAPIELPNWSAEVEFKFESGAATTTTAGFAMGGAAAIGTGHPRWFITKNGTAMGWDYFGVGGQLSNPGLADLGTTVWHKFKFTLTGEHMTYRVDDILYWTNRVTVASTSVALTRFGLFTSGPVNAAAAVTFRNLKLWVNIPPLV